jgi:hypothetical protein
MFNFEVLPGIFMFNFEINFELLIYSAVRKRSQLSRPPRCWILGSPVLAHRSSGNCPGPGQSRCSLPWLCSESLRLLPPTDGGRCICGVEPEPMGHPDQGRVLPDTQQERALPRVHCNEIRALAWLNLGPHVGRPSHSASSASIHAWATTCRLRCPDWTALPRHFHRHGMRFRLLYGSGAHKFFAGYYPTT